jgi:hypothetical protein
MPGNFEADAQTVKKMFLLLLINSSSTIAHLPGMGLDADGGALLLMLVGVHACGLPLTWL